MDDCANRPSFISKEMVVPAKPTPRHSYFLSCFDIFWKNSHYNQRVLFYESTGLSREVVMQKLKSSLALCLVEYYPWCGRLSPAGGRLAIDCNDAGVEFVEASYHQPISLLSSKAFQMKPFFEHLCPHVDHSGERRYSNPLLFIQATLFSDGGLALGVSQSHVVADGQALWNFMVSWGECARGLPLSVPPVLDRARLAVPNPSPEKATWEFTPRLKEGESLETHSSLEQEDAQPESSTGESAGTESGLEEAPVPCVLNLSSSAVKALKSQAGGVHTSYEVMCAHLWQRLTAARGRPAGEATFFFVLTNCRSRLRTPLPPAYFGNAIVFGMAASTSGKISSESLEATASRIHDVITDVSHDSIESIMHWLEINDHNIHQEIYPKVPKGLGINVASSPRFPAYEVDFGWGKPMAVRSPKLPNMLEMVVFSGCPKSAPGDVEFCASLPQGVLRWLLGDPLFLGTTPYDPFEDA